MQKIDVTSVITLAFLGRPRGRPVPPAAFCQHKTQSSILTQENIRDVFQPPVHTYVDRTAAHSAQLARGTEFTATC